MTARYELEPHHRHTPEGEFLDDLRRVAQELGSASVTINQYNERGRFSASSLQRRFGSWLEALKRADLIQGRNIHLTEEDLFANLVEVWTKLGSQPRCANLTSQTSRISCDTYKRRFGGWRKALEAFVRWANEGESPSPRSHTGKEKLARRTPRTINYRLYFLVMRRDSFNCRLTGRSPATDPAVILQVDHIVPWDSGGETVMENLQTLAKQINIGKSNLSM